MSQDVPVAVPDLPLQLIREDDVGQALLQCVVAAGPDGAYNIAADEVVSAVEWVEATTHPAVMDTTKAKDELGWSPRYSALEALRDTVR
jgi:nucleoside-diphosphate-sugar epimerase